MYVNKQAIELLEGEMAHLVQALKEDKVVELYDGPHEGWCEVKQISIYKKASDYRVVEG